MFRTFMRESVQFAGFLWDLVISGALRGRYPARRGNPKVLNILANGPSLSQALKHLHPQDNDDSDFLMLNSAAETAAFTEVKPSLYCVLDPVFYQDSCFRDDARRLYDAMNRKIDWPMVLFISSGYTIKEFRAFSRLNNPNIAIRQINMTTYRGYSCLEKFFYRKNWGVPAAQNITIMAIIIGLNSGYRSINLYGVDHNLLDGLYVDDQNHLYYNETHYYGTVRQKLLYPDGTFRKLHEYLRDIAQTFASHQKCREYADHLHIPIVNRTPGSMIDAYERGSVNADAADGKP